MDGTPVSYTSWENNEPNFANNDEHCVTTYRGSGESITRFQKSKLRLNSNDIIFIIYSFFSINSLHIGRWNDINCGMEHPSICKRSSNFINATMAPTLVPKGGCAPDWLAFQGKVYDNCSHRRLLPKLDWNSYSYFQEMNRT